MTEPWKPRTLVFGRRDVLIGGASILSVSGCAALMPPKETKIDVKMTTGADINPSPTGTPSPLLLRVYTLRSDTKFLQSDPQSLYSNDSAVLGADLLSKRDFVLAPSSEESFSATVSADAKVLGVVAGFRELALAEWRVSAPIESGVVNKANIVASKTDVAIKAQAEPKSLF